MTIHNPSCSCHVNHFPDVQNEHSDIEQAYCQSVQSCQKIILLIVGNDKYKTDPCGIAFCKRTWKELLNARVSGRYLLCAIGVNFQNIIDRYNNPITLFCEMAKKGIVFINQEDFEFTNQLLEIIEVKGMPRITLLCGVPAIQSYIKITQKLHIVEMCRVIPTIHPDIENANSSENFKLFEKKRKDAWNDCWGNYGKTIEYLKTYIPLCQSATQILSDIKTIDNVIQTL